MLMTVFSPLDKLMGFGVIMPYANFTNLVSGYFPQVWAIGIFQILSRRAIIRHRKFHHILPVPMKSMLGDLARPTRRIREDGRMDVVHFLLFSETQKSSYRTIAVKKIGGRRTPHLSALFQHTGPATGGLYDFGVASRFPGPSGSKRH